MAVDKGKGKDEIDISWILDVSVITVWCMCLLAALPVSYIYVISVFEAKLFLVTVLLKFLWKIGCLVPLVFYVIFFEIVFYVIFVPLSYIVRYIID
jgi:hypothetical protein